MTNRCELCGKEEEAQHDYDSQGKGICYECYLIEMELLNKETHDN